MRKHASEIIYDEVALLGIPALLTDWRVDRATIPNGFHLYELRHADEDWGDPCQVAKGILVNFYGSVLTVQPPPIPGSGYLDFDTQELAYVEDDACATLDKFAQKHRQSEV